MEMKVRRIIHFLKNNYLVWIALVAYIALKCVVNPQPVLTFGKNGVQLGFFNFKESSPQPTTINPIVEVNPIWKMSAYQINLEGGASLRPLSMDKQGVLHLMGTDHLGRDVMAGFICGMEIAIILGLLVSVGTGLLCLLMGSMSAYFDRFPFRISVIELILWVALSIACIVLLGWSLIGATNIGLWIIFFFICFVTLWFTGKYTNKKKYILPLGGFNRRFQEVFQPLPDIVILLVLMAVFNQIGFWGLVILLIFLRLPSGAWFIQGRAQQIVVEPHIDQAKAMAIPGHYIIIRHMVPLLMPFVRIFMSLTAARAVLSESALSFLGLGPTGEWMSWGTMIRIGLANFAIWWVAFFPIIGLVAITLIFRIGKK